MAAARKPAPAAPVEHADINAALLAVQAGLPEFQKDKVNPHFGSSYLSLESLMPQILEVLTANGLVLSQTPTAIVHPTGVVAGLRTRFTHAKTGEWAEDTMPLTAGKDNPQGQGSAITYARRYALVSALSIVADKDDDANAAQPRASAAVVGTASTGTSLDVGGAASFGGAL